MMNEAKTPLPTAALLLFAQAFRKRLAETEKWSFSKRTEWSYYVLSSAYKQRLQMLISLFEEPFDDAALFERTVQRLAAETSELHSNIFGNAVESPSLFMEILDAGTGLTFAQKTALQERTSQGKGRPKGIGKEYFQAYNLFKSGTQVNEILDVDGFCGYGCKNGHSKYCNCKERLEKGIARVSRLVDKYATK